MKIPPVLFHYTNQAGLFGIFESRELWASSIQHLNDESEFEYATRLFEAALSKVESETMMAILNLGWSRTYRMFVFSFSARKDRLSQWRAYCRDGGFSIGFDAPRLLALAHQQGFTLEKCIYRPSEHKKRVSELLNLAKLEEDSKDEPVAHSMTFLDEFMKFATTAKDKTFTEENEWRLVSLEGPGGIIPIQRPVCYRQGAAFPIPFQKFQLHDEIAKGLVREVVVGPGPHKPLVAKAVEDYLASVKCQAVVTQSETPYRNW
jgi:hypothetical protein